MASIVAKVIPGREEAFYNHAKIMEKAIADQPDVIAVLKAHYLKWLLFPINGELYMMYQGIFDTDFDKYTEDAVALFNKTGISTVFENLEGWPKDWRQNPAACVKFFRDHHCPSFLEYSEHPYVSCEEIKKALRLKAAFTARAGSLLFASANEEGRDRDKHKRSAARCVGAQIF
jgi:hypothetical protein